MELLLVKTEDIKRSRCSFPTFLLDCYRRMGVYGRADGRAGV